MPDPQTIDARGLRCPMPTLKLAKALQSAAPGVEVTLLADDPMARVDVPHFCGEAGVQLLEVEDAVPAGWAFRVRAKG